MPYNRNKSISGHSIIGEYYFTNSYIFERTNHSYSASGKSYSAYSYSGKYKLNKEGEEIYQIHSASGANTFHCSFCKKARKVSGGMFFGPLDLSPDLDDSIGQLVVGPCCKRLLILI